MSNKNYNAESCLEEVRIDEEIETIHRTSSDLQFPAVIYRKSGTMYINVKAIELFRHKYVRFATTPEYVIMLPAISKTIDAFAISEVTNGKGKTIRIPAELHAKRITEGAHRLYKYKNGLCFKRYETVEMEGVEHDG